MFPGDVLPTLTADSLKDHVDRMQKATQEDWDKLLHDLFVKSYPTSYGQKS